MKTAKEKTATKALITLLHNAQDNSWHPAIFIELIDKKARYGQTRFGAVKYREPGFFVRENAVKAIKEDGLVSITQANGYTEVCVDTRSMYSWSGKNPPKHIVKYVRTEYLADVEPLKAKKAIVEPG
jgi:hypothetical protein